MKTYSALLFIPFTSDDYEKYNMCLPVGGANKLDFPKMDFSKLDVFKQ
jgi:hypothetical protein